MASPDDPEYAGCPATVIEARAAGVELVPARWGVGDVVSMVLIAVGLALAGGAVLAALQAPLATTVIVGGLLSWVGLAGWPILATLRRGNGPRIDLGLRLTWSDVRSGLIGGLIALLLAGAVTVVLVRLIGSFDSAAGAAAARLIDEGDRGALIAFSMMILVGAPIVEELAFRGLVFGVVRKRGLGTAWAVGVSAVLFSLVHFEPARILVLLAIGIVLGMVRARTGSTGAAMIAHAAVNAPGALFLLLGAPGMTP